MKLNKCPHCGAGVTTDKEDNIAKCLYCGSTFEAERTTIDHNTQTNTPNQDQHISYIPKRPRVRASVVLILCFISFIFAIVYIAYVREKQKSWDDKYTR